MLASKTVVDQASAMTPTPTPAESPTPVLCAGDRNPDDRHACWLRRRLRRWRQRVDELVRGVHHARQPGGRRTAFDVDDNGAVTVDELVQAVGAALNGCSPRWTRWTPMATDGHKAPPLRPTPHPPPLSNEHKPLHPHGVRWAVRVLGVEVGASGGAAAGASICWPSVSICDSLLTASASSPRSKDHLLRRAGDLRQRGASAACTLGPGSLGLPSSDSMRRPLAVVVIRT